MDVNLGNGRVERIVVNEGDKSEDLADRFAKDHCNNFKLKILELDTNTRKKFKELLDS